MNNFFSLIFLAVILLSGTVKAQAYKITGSLSDSDNHSIAGALVLLSKSNGEQIRGKALSDSTGIFILSVSDTGYYKLLVTANDFQSEDIDLALKGNMNLGRIILKPKFKSVGEVTIYAKKSIFERKKDRFIFNATPDLIALTTNSYELLGLTPLVTTRENGSISLSGVENVLVYINGRKINLTGQALQSYLQNIPSKSIARIELLTTPSSRSDAEGNAGIINIVLNQSNSDGLVGNIGASIKQAHYLTRYGSYTMNLNKQRWSMLMGISPSGQRLLIEQASDVNFPDAAMGKGYRVENEVQKKLLPSNTINGNIGVEYKLSKREVLGVASEYFDSRLTRQIQATTFYKPNDTNLIDSIYYTNNSNKEKSKILTITGYYKLKIDSSSYLNVEATTFSYKNEANATTKSIKEPFSLLSSYFINELKQQIKNKSIQLDYTKNFNSKYSIEAGLKYSLTNTVNNIDFSNWNGVLLLPDPSKSSDFDYNETIFAGYLTMSHTLSKRFNYQIGARVEKTMMESSDNFTNRAYAKLFPTLYLNYLTLGNLSISYAIAGRIGRPSFIDLNPFRYYLTDKIFILGNPLLRPTTNLKHELSIAKGQFVLQVVYNSNKGIISTESLLDTASKTFYYTKGNFSDLKTFAMNFSFFKSLAPWVRVNLSSSFGWKYFDGLINNQVVSTHSTYGNISMFANLTVSKKYKLYSSFYISSTFPYVSNLAKVKGQGNLAFGLRRTTSKISYGFSIQDPFKWSIDQYKSFYSTGSIYERSYYDARGISAFINIPFGKQTVLKLKKKDPASSLDEKNRL